MQEPIDELTAALHDLSGMGLTCNEQKVASGQRPCPICGKIMQVDTHESVTIDVCLAHGVWLDHGELSTIISRASRNNVAAVRRKIHDAKRKGKVSGAVFGIWSLLLD